MNNLKIIGRFKIYNNLVVGEDKNIYQLAHFIKPKTIPFRKLKYYPKKNAYGLNGSYISKSRLLNLFVPNKETINNRLSKNI